MLSYSLDVKQCEKDEQKSTSLCVGVINWVNFSAGAGFLGISNTLCGTGFAFGILSHLLILAMITWSDLIVLKFSAQSKKSSLAEVAEEILGAFGYWFVNIVVWLYLSFCLIAYFMFLSELTAPLLRYIGKAHLLQDNSNFSRYFTVGAIVVLYPTYLLRDLKPLAKVSALAAFCVICFGLGTTIAFASEKSPKFYFRFLPQRDFGLRDSMKVFGVPMFIYLTIMAIPDFARASASEAQVRKTIYFGNLTLLVLYFWASIPAYLYLGNDLCQGNSEDFFIHLFGNDYQGLIISIASTCLLVNVGLITPCYHFLLRRRSYLILERVCGRDGNLEDMSTTFLTAHTILIPLFCGIGFVMKGVLTFVAFTGMFAGSFLVFILPALLEMSDNGGVLFNFTWTLARKRKGCDVNLTHVFIFNAFLYIGVGLFVNSIWEFIASKIR